MEIVMSAASPTRRDLVAISAAVGAVSLLSAHTAVTAESNAIRPFRIDLPEAELIDLRRRIAVTRWPDRETVNDQSQGIQLAKLQGLVR